MSDLKVNPVVAIRVATERVLRSQSWVKLRLRVHNLAVWCTLKLRGKYRVLIDFILFCVCMK